MLIDRAQVILDEMNQVREIFEQLQLSKEAKKVFSWKFFEGNNFSEWEGTQDKQKLYEIYNRVIVLIKDKLQNRGLF